MGYTGECGGWPKVQQFVDSKLLGNSNNEKVVSRDAETQTQEIETTHKNLAGLNWIENIKGQLDPKLKEILFPRSEELQVPGSAEQQVPGNGEQ